MLWVLGRRVEDGGKGGGERAQSVDAFLSFAKSQTRLRIFDFSLLEILLDGDAWKNGIYGNENGQRNRKIDRGRVKRRERVNEQQGRELRW